MERVKVAYWKGKIIVIRKRGGGVLWHRKGEKQPLWSAGGEIQMSFVHKVKRMTEGELGMVTIPRKKSRAFYEIGEGKGSIKKEH